MAGRTISIAIAADAGPAKQAFQEAESAAESFGSSVSEAMQDMESDSKAAFQATESAANDFGAKLTRALQATVDKMDKLDGGINGAIEKFDTAEFTALGFADSLSGIQGGMDGISSIAKGDFSEGISSLTMSVADLSSGFANFLLPTISKGISFLRGFSLAQWASNAAFLASPITWVVIGIVALVAVLVIAWKNSETFRRILTGAFDGIKNAAAGAFNWVKTNWPLLLAIITGPIGLAVLAFTKYRGQILGVFGNIKDAITGVFSSAGTWLKNAGTNIIQGFLDGLRGGFDRVKQELTRLTDLLPDWKGPPEKDKRILRGSGQLVIGGFQDGLTSAMPAVRTELSRFTDSMAQTAVRAADVSAAGAGSAFANAFTDITPQGTVALGVGSAVAAQNLSTTIEFKGDGSRAGDALLDLIKSAIRVRGGDPLTVLSAR